MALCFESVKVAYTVFNQVKNKHIPNLLIPAFPEDTADWSQEEKSNPRRNMVCGYDQKYDNGWESLFFYVEDPTEELKADFQEWAKAVPNTSISRLDKESGYWRFGWF
ncbi:hypothetical protein [Roseivirga thermotolerans]|uniref:Uncharacterized protein n=1 Tax=Roseivirga thermotolerans TaxID=1758176 RepID=A0ABQ3I532_9BACT|nr:hypothetical protein [Roseivirga thermotolerans]GHE65155.1 hypothetical protein GCM10011340_20280 [Roseivirga thermotolerans]